MSLLSAVNTADASVGFDVDSPPSGVFTSTFTDTDGTEYQVIGFESTGSHTLDITGEVDILLVGGGGGSATDSGNAADHTGGGGGGGVVFVTDHTVSGQYNINVGDGGVGDENGGDSSFEGLGTALGGGHGGCDKNDPIPAADGGCGGGAGRNAAEDSSFVSAGQGLQPNQTITTDGTVVHNAGNDGGRASQPYGTGGGGGAGEPGSDSTSSTGGDSGDGLQINFTGNNYYWGGGGGGGTSQNEFGYDSSTFGPDGAPGGLGGGGGGGSDSVDKDGSNDHQRGANDTNGINNAFTPNNADVAVPGYGGKNTGGGSGGSGKKANVGTGYSGGSGIVLVRYEI